MNEIERRSGVAMWRQIADDIRFAIAAAEFAVGHALPPETALAARFGVNRHTVRSAIASLVAEGLLKAERGRGTFVQKRDRLRFPIRRRTRFSEGLADQSSAREGRLVAASEVAAEPAIATALSLQTMTPLIRLDMIYLVEEMPISLAANYFPKESFAGIADDARRTGSITAALKACGVSDYTRKWTTITARHADGDDLAALKLSPGAIVLHGAAVNVDPEGNPIQYAVTRFAADRVELTVEN